MKWYHWLVLFVIAFYAVDELVGRYLHWRKERDELIRNERLNRYNVAAFRGTRKIDKDQFLS